MEDVETAGGFQDAVEHAGHVGRLQKINDDRIGAFADLVAKLFQLILGAIDENHLRASGMQCAGAFEADAGGGSGNGGDFSFHGNGHVFSPDFGFRRGRCWRAIDGQASRRSRQWREPRR